MMMIATTQAKIGRSMKKRDSAARLLRLADMARASALVPRATAVRVGAARTLLRTHRRLDRIDRHAGLHLLQSLDDHAVARRQARIDQPLITDRRASP